METMGRSSGSGGQIEPPDKPEFEILGKASLEKGGGTAEGGDGGFLLSKNNNVFPKRNPHRPLVPPDRGNFAGV